MSTIRDQMLQAQDFIKQKRYDEARTILQQIDHPKAHQWLAKLDEVAPPAPPAQQGRRQRRQQAIPEVAPTTTSASGKKRRTRHHPRRRRRLPLLLLSAILLFAIVAAAYLALGLDEEDNGDSADTPVEVEDTGDETGDETDDETGDTGDMTDTGDMDAMGERLQFVNDDALFTVDLPAGWFCDCYISVGNLQSAANGGDPVNVDLLVEGFFEFDYYFEQPLPDILTAQLREDDVIQSQETVQAGEREVLIANVHEADDPEAVETRYLVKDSDGHTIQLEIPDYVDDPAALHDMVLAIASTIEGDVGDPVIAFADQLRATTISYNPDLNQWRIVDILNSDKEHTLELSPDWSIQPLPPMAIKSGSYDTSATAFTYWQPYYYESKTDLTEAVDAFVIYQDETIQDQETTTVNGREIVFATLVEDEDSSTVNYFAFDSDGDLFSLIIQPNVLDKASLHDDVLAIASKIEVNDLAYQTLLQRAGLTDDPPPDDGFGPPS